MSSKPTIRMPISATARGRRSTNPAQRLQKPSSTYSPAWKRRGNSRTLLIRWPSSERSAGSRVIEAITDTAGISMPPMPIARMNGSGRMIMLKSPIATVEPETITERPARRMVAAIASSTSSPFASSSRKRKIISSE